MNIQAVEYKNYRNLQYNVIIPQDGINIIYGKNAQGKTNLLEALWLFTGGRSFRGSKDADLIAREAQKAEVKIEFFSEERVQTAQINIENGRRSAILNGIPKKSTAELVGKFYAVIFSPEHLSLVREGPSFRRDFIDSALCQIKPGYAGLLSRYNRTLIQRNTLLKDISRHSELLDTLEIWDEKLAKYGEALAVQRSNYVDLLREPAIEIYAGICENSEKIDLIYQKNTDDLRQSLHASHRDDIYSGHTSAGPHRDDLEITINSESARSFGSQGQKRSIVLALKLAEAEILYRQSGERPVILLDDVMSELDSGRQDYLLNHFNDCQVFITCCEPGSIERLQEGTWIEIENGAVKNK